MSEIWRAVTLTIFPEMFPGPLGVSLAGKALAAGTTWSLDVVDIRTHATDKHRTVDDTPAGGGPGMVMKPDVLARALDAASPADDTRPRLLMSPRGRPIGSQAPFQRISLPMAQAASSTTGTPRARATSTIDGRSHGIPS